MKPEINVSVELSHQCPLDEIKSHASILESRGFYRVWIPDTLVSPWEAWLAASIVAQNTRNILIGLGVTNPFTRHPVVMAQMAATLQHLSNQRLSLSLGRGIARFMEKAGIQTNPHAEKECLAILRGLTGGEKMDFQGQAFRLEGIRLRVPPPERPLLLYRAVGSIVGWRAALEDDADGVVTFWGPEAAENRKQALAEKPLLTAAMTPFTLSGKAFFGGAVTTLETLKQQREAMGAAGFDEMIIAYRDKEDLEAAAGLVRR
jgi:alkanesulfonate monooxygenase SsuD/methylene tetrahydromethanopterin reductase-like flavin-dependent oxidoreductase (luciferase family)